MTDIDILDGLSSWDDRYDAILCDVWGVLHDGANLHPGALDALQRFRAGGGHVLLVSNSPRPGPLVIEQLTEMGVPRDVYDDVLSSGDIARAWLGQRPGLRIGLVTAPMHTPMHDGLDLRIVEPEDAEYLVVTAMADDENESPDDYRTLLEAHHAAGVPMLCANPDFIVERGGQLVHCAGALADMYRDMGGIVIDTGKPSTMIYDEAVQRVGAMRGTPIDHERMLAIGDSVRTDLRGAATLGIDMLFMARGIHAKDVMTNDRIDGQKLAALFAEEMVKPTAVQEKLVW